jgi:hypothetical protein
MNYVPLTKFMLLMMALVKTGKREGNPLMPEVIVQNSSIFGLKSVPYQN